MGQNFLKILRSHGVRGENLEFERRTCTDSNTRMPCAPACHPGDEVAMERADVVTLQSSASELCGVRGGVVMTMRAKLTPSEEPGFMHALGLLENTYFASALPRSAGVYFMRPLKRRRHAAQRRRNGRHRRITRAA